MTLRDWVTKELAEGRDGAISKLQRATGLAYTTVHAVVHGGACKYETARKISEATRGEVSILELLSQRPERAAS